MKEMLELVFSSFWTFVGTAILLGMPLNFAFNCWNRWCRTRNIKERGWPPHYCDADGDFKPEPGEED